MYGHQTAKCGKMFVSCTGHSSTESPYIKNIFVMIKALMITSGKENFQNWFVSDHHRDSFFITTNTLNINLNYTVRFRTNLLKQPAKQQTELSFITLLSLNINRSYSRIDLKDVKRWIKYDT